MHVYIDVCDATCNVLVRMYMHSVGISHMQRANQNTP